jgi:hypothetical protein
LFDATIMHYKKIEIISLFSVLFLIVRPYVLRTLKLLRVLFIIRSFHIIIVSMKLNLYHIQKLESLGGPRILSGLIGCISTDMYNMNLIYYDLRLLLAPFDMIWIYYDMHVIFNSLL